MSRFPFVIVLASLLWTPSPAGAKTQDGISESPASSGKAVTRRDSSATRSDAVASPTPNRIPEPGLSKPLMHPSTSAPPAHSDLMAFPGQTTRSSREWGTVLTDIARHLPDQERYQDAFRRYIEAGDLVTAGHEWTHFLNEVLTLKAGVNRSAYYLLNGRFMTLTDPEGLRGYLPRIPASLKGELYDLYLVQNGSNAKVDPLYLFDEWSAYTNDVTLAVDQLEEGKPLDSNHRGAVQPHTAGNVIEFMFYGFAVGMAVREHDRAYYNGPEGSKLREFIVLNAERSIGIHEKAMCHSELSKGDQRNEDLIHSFRTSPDTAEMRNFVKRELGGEIADVLLGPGFVTAAVSASW